MKTRAGKTSDNIIILLVVLKSHDNGEQFIMKCLICGERTEKKLLCPKHMGVDARLQYLTVHYCNSFKQKKGEPEGVCEFYLLCEPIKKALKHEILMSSNIGHIVCPHAEMNLNRAVYSEVSEEEIRSNYPECLE